MPLQQFLSALSVYYGPSTPEALRVLACCQTVVIQPTLFAGTQVQELRAGGTRVLGYLSVGEDHPFGDGAWSPGERPFHRTVNPGWGSVVVDAAHPEWTRTVLERAERVLEQADGLLLDTLESADPAAALALVSALRARWPDAVLFSNRGFSLWPDLTPLIQGVLIEAFSTTHVPEYAPHEAGGLEYTAFWLARSREAGLEPLGLDYADSPGLLAFAQERARGHALPTFITNRELSWPAGTPPT